MGCCDNCEPRAARPEVSYEGRSDVRERCIRLALEECSERKHSRTEVCTVVAAEDEYFTVPPGPGFVNSLITCGGCDNHVSLRPHGCFFLGQRRAGRAGG